MRKNHIVFTKCSIFIILFTGVLLPELSAALTDNLKGYWRFESPSWFAANEVCSWIGADNEVTDSSFSGSDGTANNFGQSTVSGKVGHAASFDGLTRFITVNSINQSSWANGTISLWMKTSVTSDPDVYQYLFQRGTGARPELAIRETGLFRFGIYDGTTNYTLYSSTGYNDNQWHQVTVTWGSGGMKMYVDGALVSSNTFTGTFQNIEAPWYIGAKNAGGSNYFNGSIDEVAIWSRALSAAEITQLYNEGKGMVITVGSK